MSTLTQLAEVARRLAALNMRRDELIREAHDEGHSLRTVGEAAQLTHAGVAKIVKR